MKKLFHVSLCRNGLIGGFLSFNDKELIYNTNKLTISENYCKINIFYQDIERYVRGNCCFANIYIYA